MATHLELLYCCWCINQHFHSVQLHPRRPVKDHRDGHSSSTLYFIFRRYWRHRIRKCCVQWWFHLWIMKRMMCLICATIYQYLPLATITAKTLDCLLDRILTKPLHLQAEFGFGPGMSTESALSKHFNITQKDDRKRVSTICRRICAVRRMSGIKSLGCPAYSDSLTSSTRIRVSVR